MKKQNHLTAFLNNAATIDFIYYFGQRGSAVLQKNRRLFDEINEVLNGKEENCKCNTIELMRIFSKDGPAVDVWFATEAGNSEKGCEYLIINNKGPDKRCYRLTYRMGMYLDELRIQAYKKLYRND